ncbi:MAG: type VI secretion system tip protein VgrG [Chitinispirillales bacterium]|jgi:type VI secretion system VgrG family protein|nr:type VI secretion system tip protein VgrG [Chitinispirillales bacterium]
MSIVEKIVSAGDANRAKFLICIADFAPSLFTVTRFTGKDAISAPYCFDVDFQFSDSAPLSGELPAITPETVLGKPCIFKLLRGAGDAAVYSGVIKQFSLKHGKKNTYSIRLVPAIDLLSLNINNKIFQKLTVIEIIEKVIESAGLKTYCDFEFKCEHSYQPLTFCVQHQESDLNFISRLMERNGIWYFFEQSGGTGGKERVVITDAFSGFPKQAAEIQFKESTGFTEVIKNTANGVSDGFESEESIYSLSSKHALIPKSVRLRTQNYRTPEYKPEAVYEIREGSGTWGNIYEYGGDFKNGDEAERMAALYMKRIQVENLHKDGESVCKGFRAGRVITVSGGIGGVVITSVNHEGGAGEGGGYAYGYKNSFGCINSSAQTYAPPLRASIPRTSGLITAPVEALGEDYPTLDEMGRYRVKMPSDRSKTEAYSGTKDVRVAQPSGGAGYGFHFPSKSGAEMLLGYVDENPDKPVGIGFLPNAAAPSVVCNTNRNLNVICTGGGNKLVMDDTEDNEIICLTTPDKASLGDNSSYSLREWARLAHKEFNDFLEDAEKVVETIEKIVGIMETVKETLEKLGEIFKGGVGRAGDRKNCELLLDNKRMTAILRAWEHRIILSCNEKQNLISLTTGGGNAIWLDDARELILLKTTNGCAIGMVDGKDSIILSNASSDSQKPNNILLDGQNKIIKIETGGGCKMEMCDPQNSIIISNADETNTVTLDGKNGIVKVATKDGCTIVMDNEKDIITLVNASEANKVILDGKDKTLSLESTGYINIKAAEDIKFYAGGNIYSEAGKDISTRGQRDIISFAEEKILTEAKKDNEIKGRQKIIAKGKKVKLN